jgi:tetratricopeptide (TPR) repeat protein
MNKRMFKDNQNHPDIADSFSNFGHYYLKNGNYNQSLVNYEKAFAINKELYENENVRIADSLIDLGFYYLKRNDYNQASKLFNTACEMKHSLYQANLDHPEIANLHIYLGKVNLNLGDYNSSLIHFQEAYKLSKSIFHNYDKDDFAQMIKIQKNLAKAYLKTKDFKSALRNYEEALRITSNIYSNENHEEINFINTKLGNLLKFIKYR